jgi:hypothetical protein
MPPGRGSWRRSARKERKMQTSEWLISHRIGHLVAALCLITIGSTTASAQADRACARDLTAVVVTGYGPGVAGQIIEGPTRPVCRPNTPCTRPFANATVLVLDGANRNTVSTAVTKAKSGAQPHPFVCIKTPSPMPAAGAQLIADFWISVP